MAALGVCISRVWAAGIRQIEHMVHLGSGQRNGRRVDPQVSGGTSFAMRLHQGTGIAGIGLEVQHPVGMGIQHWVAFHLLVAGQADDAFVAGWDFDFAGNGVIANEVKHFLLRLLRRFAPRSDVIASRARQSRSTARIQLILPRTRLALRHRLLAHHQIRIHMRLNPPRHVYFCAVNFKPTLRGVTHHESRATHIGNLGNGFFGCQAMRHFHQGAFGVAIQQQICFGINEDGSTHLVLPVVIVGNTT